MRYRAAIFFKHKDVKDSIFEHAARSVLFQQYMLDYSGWIAEVLDKIKILADGIVTINLDNLSKDAYLCYIEFDTEINLTKYLLRWG